jgi:RNA-directed DNA polymerase
MLDQLTARGTLYQAFERVRENCGCRGADGMTVGDFAARLEEEIDRLEDRLLRRVYHPFPLLRLAIPKRTSGMRHLSIPTVRDRVVQTAVDLVTRDLFEKEFEDCSYAYRCGRSVRSAIHRIRELRDQGYGWVVDADIDAFFDNIPHGRMIERLRRLPLDPYVVALFEKWVQVEVYDGQRIRSLTKGIPQGSVTSPMLANLFLDELDENLALFGQVLVRYGDDFVILCKTPEAAAEALELTDYLLSQIELHLNHEKTRLTSFDQGFKFLGAVFLKADVYLPFERTKPEYVPPHLPPPLDLQTYLELRSAE